MRTVVTEDNLKAIDALLGKRVLVICAKYIYNGLLVGIDDFYLKLEDPAIVYETGEWSSPKYQDCQKLHARYWLVAVQAVESIGEGK